LAAIPYIPNNRAVTAFGDPFKKTNEGMILMKPLPDTVTAIR